MLLVGGIKCRGIKCMAFNVVVRSVAGRNVAIPNIYIVPLQRNYSEVLPTSARPKRYILIKVIKMQATRF